MAHLFSAKIKWIKGGRKNESVSLGLEREKEKKSRRVMRHLKMKHLSFLPLSFPVFDKSERVDECED